MAEDRTYSPRDMEIEIRLARIEDKLDAMSGRFKALDDHEVRISKLERAQIYRNGWIAGAAFAGAAACEILRRLFGM